MVKTRRPLLPTATSSAVVAPPPSDTEVGFAKLQGEDFEYYMQTYSITLGRTSKKHPEISSEIDLDLGDLGGGMNVSRRHARIFYDFPRRRFALEVLGKNGCVVEGVLHVPGSPPVKLDSQDLLQMGDAQFYFLLPTRSIFDAPVGPPRLLPRVDMDNDDDDEEEEEEEEEEEDMRNVVMVGAKRPRIGKNTPARHLGQYRK